MSANNPAHKARVKITPVGGSERYLHYQNGWTVTLAHGQTAALSFAGFPHYREAAIRFALNECRSPVEVLRTCLVEGSSECTYVLDSGLSPLQERLIDIAEEAREEGYALVIFGPDDLKGVDVEDLEQQLAEVGNNIIANHEPDDEEE